MNTLRLIRALERVPEKKLLICDVLAHVYVDGKIQHKKVKEIEGKVNLAEAEINAIQRAIHSVCSALRRVEARADD